MSSTTKVALVTGASSGIGADAALRLKEAGYAVYGAARRTERMSALQNAGVEVLSLDVTDDDSIRTAVDTIIRHSGRIDVLVNKPVTAPTAPSRTSRWTRRAPRSRSTSSAWHA
jgi:NADP-dependent 3-hydroxy acid dehydrogenase YdfG